MSGLLRFLRIVNAAVWSGSSVFLLVGLPALFSAQLEALLSKPYVGFAAEAIFQRYFVLYYCCATVALLCLVGEWVYSGKAARGDLALVGGLTAVGLLSGLMLQPRLRDWHYFKYWGKTPELRDHAAHLFGLWHGISEAVNLVVIVGLIFYLWRTCRPSATPRFVGFNKIRG